MAFTLLHVSDVHFGPHCQVTANHPPGAGRQLADLLVKDLKARLKEPVDAIVASGDFTWTNDRQEFQCALFFLRELASALGVPVKETVVVPGNHDIAWSQADPALAAGFKFLVSREAQRRYREFVHHLRGIDAGERLTTVQIFEKAKVAIVGFDSCRLVNKQDAGLGYVGLDQVEHGIALLRRNPVYRSNEQGFLKIAVLHHHILPALDLDLSVLRQPPADRRFSLTLDAASVMRLLLADNFALVLHGHLHVPFGAVERRVWGPAGALDTDRLASLAVTAAGSLSVKEPHAERNEYQVIVIDGERLRFRVVSDLFGRQAKERAFELPRASLTRPVMHLELGSESKRQVEGRRLMLAESAILAERIARRESAAVNLLFELVQMSAGKTFESGLVDSGQFRELFDSVVESWLSGADPTSRYAQAAARHGVTLPEYILRLMMALRGLS